MREKKQKKKQKEKKKKKKREDKKLVGLNKYIQQSFIHITA